VPAVKSPRRRKNGRRAAKLSGCQNGVVIRGGIPFKLKEREEKQFFFEKKNHKTFEI
jgi:hypothetical protein